MHLSDLPPLREIIAQHGLTATKTLGQNFLLDLNLTRKIVRSAGNLAGRHVLEIGPGPGGLTRALVEGDAASITAIEYDTRAVGALQSLVQASSGRLTVIHGDALAVDVTRLVPAPRAIVANLPYNIATPLLIGWLRQASAFDSLTLMFQREVAERIVAAPASEAYGRLAVMTGWLMEARILFDLPPQAFTPPPKVTSSVVHLKPRETPLATDFATMEKVVAAAFGQRRKMMRSALKLLGGDTEALLEAAGIKPTDRAEVLDVAAFVRLSRAFADRTAAT
jgi:16S rRNA (adenine1518-N6/adenine1519-N6)-dimethyltransferase